MAANVASLQRQSLRLQNARVDADSGAAATSSGTRGPAKPRISGNAKRISAEKRKVDTGGQERSLGTRRSTETPHKENETDTAPSTGRNKKRDVTESAHPMEPKGAHPMEPNTETVDSTHSPGGEHSRNIRPRRNRNGSSLHVADSNREGSSSTDDNTSFSRDTRSSKSKNYEVPGSSTAVRGLGEGAISSKQKNDTAHLPEPNFEKEQGSEGPGESSSHDGSLRPRRSHDGSITNRRNTPRGAAGTNTPLQRQTRSSGGKKHEGPGASTAIRGKGAISNKKKTENIHLAKPNSQKEGAAEDPGGSNSHDRSLQLKRSHEGSSLNVEHCSFSSTVTLNRKEQVIRPSNQSERALDISGGVRSPGKNLRPRRSHDGSGISSGKSVTVKGSDGKKEKRGESEPRIQSGEVSQDPGGSISPRKHLETNLNLEDPVDRRQPSDVTTESNTGEAPRDYKVQCCSKQLLQEVLGMCTGICKGILDSQQYLNEEQKQQHHKNFAWDFETAFQENVGVNGLSWHEAPDEDSEPDIKILEDQMDEVMVKTSIKRKRYPRKILSHFVKTLKTEREILNQYNPAMNPRKVTLDPAFEFRMKDLSATAVTVCQHIHETKKALPIQLEKAEGFSQVLNLQPLLAESHIRKDIFYSRVVLEDISKSIPKVLETTLPESEPKALATPVRSLRKRRISLPQRHLYPIRSKRKISLES